MDYNYNLCIHSCNKKFMSQALLVKIYIIYKFMLQIISMAMSNSVMLRTISDVDEWIKINNSLCLCFKYIWTCRYYNCLIVKMWNVCIVID